MTRQTWYIIGGLAVLLLFMAKNWLSLALTVIAELEDFRPHPYWDVSRWSWGYGTAAPGPTGTITRAQAIKDATQHVIDDKTYLSRLVRRPLKANQWAALLSFSYQEGPGNADNLVNNINSGDDAALEIQWKKYILVGGQPNNNTIARRAREWKLWSQNIF